MQHSSASHETLYEHLSHNDLFAELAEATLKNIDPAPEWIEVPGNTDILVQGDVGRFFYLLVHGRMSVTVEDRDGKRRRVATIRAGEGVGEMSLMSERPVTATVTTLRDSSLIRFSKQSFDGLFNNNPRAALAISRKIIERLENTLQGVRSSQDLSTIAVRALDHGISVQAFCHELVEALRFKGQVAIIDRLPEGEKSFSRYLHDVEDDNPHVVLACGPEDRDWWEVCSRQADHVLLLQRADSNPAVVKDLGNADITDLVLVHDKQYHPDCRIHERRRAVKFQNVFHVRSGFNKDLKRLARIITGSANNLILSGGAAHSFAQIGVIRALEERGIPIDRVCGTSMGSMIGAQYCQGKSLQEMLDENRYVWSDGKPLSDLTFPATAIVRGKRLQNLVREALGEQDIEDLPLPFSCVSTNLTQARAEYHDRGSLWRAVRASGTIPGIGPPLVRNGELLVDGGIMSNLPVNLFRRHNTGKIIAVDMGVRSMNPVSTAWDDRVDSGWTMLWRQLNPLNKSETLPSVMSILYRTATLGSIANDSEAKNAELCLSLHLAEHNALDFRLIDQIAEEGYRFAKKYLAENDLSSISLGD